MLWLKFHKDEAAQFLYHPVKTPYPTLPRDVPTPVHNLSFNSQDMDVLTPLIG